MRQLQEIHNCISNSLGNQRNECFVFCDFSEVFDNGWHRSLSHKMIRDGDVPKYFLKMPQLPTTYNDST